MRYLKGLVGVVILALASCNNSTTTREEQPRKVKCEAARQVCNNEEQNNFPGKVVAATDLNLGFRVAGIIASIPHKEGDYVRQGEVIARLDSRDYALQLAATQAEYDAVKGEVDRVVALYKEESVSANDYDKATNGLRAITAKLEAHKNALADTQLRAPISGYFQKSNFGKGEAVAAGTPVVSIISEGAPEITLDIPAANYLNQANFERATATLEHFHGRLFHLTMKSISPKANLNQLYKVTFVIDEEEGDPLPVAGMSAMVQMHYMAQSESGVLIPFSAIVERDGGSSVWVVEKNRVTSREVTVREIRRNGTAHITRGLRADEVVVVAGVNSLQEGEEVSPLAKATPSNVGSIK